MSPSLEESAAGPLRTGSDMGSLHGSPETSIDDDDDDNGALLYK